MILGSAYSAMLQDGGLPLKETRMLILAWILAFKQIEHYWSGVY